MTKFPRVKTNHDSVTLEIAKDVRFKINRYSITSKGLTQLEFDTIHNFVKVQKGTYGEIMDKLSDVKLLSKLIPRLFTTK